MKKGILAYNPENNRYGLLRSDLWEIEGFHCGETLDVQIDGEWLPTRMEMNIEGEWYLVGTPYRGEALQFLTVRVSR